MYIEISDIRDVCNFGCHYPFHCLVQSIRLALWVNWYQTCGVEMADKKRVVLVGSGNW